MAILTNKQLIRAVKRLAGGPSVMDGSKLEKEKSGVRYYTERCGYVLGGQGEVYSKELAEKWGNAKRAGKSKSYFVKSCAHWYGRRVVDCSGMIVEAFREYDSDFGDKTADYFYNSYTTERGKIKTMPEEKGLIVWKSGHIGVYAGSGRVIEARGYKHGVVSSDLHTQKWTHWGRLKNVQYISEKPVAELSRVLEYKKGRKTMRGDDVTSVQDLLIEKGFMVEKDGKYGPATKNAVADFQRSVGLNGKGRVGEKTVEALGGKWVKA